MLASRAASQPVRCLRQLIRANRFATVGAATFFGKPPKVPVNAPPPSLTPINAFNKRILSSLDDASPSLPALIEQYVERSGNVLEVSLPYESRPPEDRRTVFDELDNAVYMIAHALQYGAEQKMTVCSGFALDTSNGEKENGEAIVVTCAHTLEEIRHSSLMASLLPSDKGAVLSSINTSHPNVSQQPKHKSGSFVISTTSPSSSTTLHPVASIESALHRADLMLLSLSAPSGSSLRTLPISPYPVHPGTSIRAHFVVDKMPEEDGWKPWVGGTWSKWVKGIVLGYRDFAGREAQPGTYDALSHMLFKPLPTPGSSGGPIVDEDSGAVVGMMLGTRMDNRIEGVRGWGVPSEMIFEMFSLPGFNLNKKHI